MPAIYRGRDGVVKVGDPSADIVAGVQSWAVDHSIEINEVYSLGDTSKGKEGGFEDWSGNFVAYIADGFSIRPGQKLVAEFYPGGETETGAFYVSGNILVESINLPQGKDDVRVPITVNFQGDGPIVYGAVT